MRFLPIIAALGLGGCASGLLGDFNQGLEPLSPAPIMENAQCRAEATRGPVRNAARQSNFENQTQVRRLLTEERDAERRLYEDCMRRLGLPTPGGVEPIRRVQ